MIWYVKLGHHEGIFATNDDDPDKALAKAVREFFRGEVAVEEARREDVESLAERGAYIPQAARREFGL